MLTYSNTHTHAALLLFKPATIPVTTHINTHTHNTNLFSSVNYHKRPTNFHKYTFRHVLSLLHTSTDSLSLSHTHTRTLKYSFIHWRLVLISLNGINELALKGRWT